MDKLQQWVALTVVGCLAVVTAGWFLLIAPERAEAAGIREQARGQEVTNRSLEEQLKVLEAQSRALPKEHAALAALATKIPDTPALPALVRALSAAGEQAGVQLVSITPQQPVLAAAADAAPAPAAAAETDEPATPAAPAAGSRAGQLASMGLVVNVEGGYFELLQFLTALEEMPRVVRVSNLGMAPAAVTGSTSQDGATGAAAPAAVDDGRRLSATFTGEVFLAVPPGAAAPGAATAPSGAPSDAPATTGEQPATTTGADR